MRGYREKGARLFLQMHRTLGNVATQEIPITRQNYFNHEAAQASEWGADRLRSLHLFILLTLSTRVNQMPSRYSFQPELFMILDDPSESCEFNFMIDNVPDLKVACLKQLIKPIFPSHFMNSHLAESRFQSCQFRFAFQKYCFCDNNNDELIK